MGFLSKIFGEKPKTEKAVPIWADLSKEDEFEAQYGEAIRRKEERIDEATWTESDNPDAQKRAYEKALDLCDELEAFCQYECGEYGSTYFLDHCADIKTKIEADFARYMEDEYPAQKEEWNKEQAKKRQFSAIKRKILKFVTEKGGVMRKEIYALYPTEQQAEVLKAINALIKDGKIKKQMDGRRLLFLATKTK